MKKLILITSAVFFTFSLSAQNMRSGYFMDGYAFAHEMNPALTSSRGYFSIPALGNFNLSASTSLSLSSILYPKADGSGLTTFLNQEISAGQALSKFKDSNSLELSTNLPVISFGFWGKRLFHNFELSLRADVNASLPYDLFRFAKEGSVNGNIFNLDNTSLGLTTYMSAAYGFSLPIGKYVRFGAKAKVLFGILAADLNLAGTRLEASKDRWMVSTAGNLALALPAGVDAPVDENGLYDWSRIGDSFSDYDISSIGESFGSAGAAVDLGVEVTLFNSLRLSAAVTDLGFISWNNYNAGEGLKDSDGKPLEYVVIDGNSTPDDFSAVGERLQDCIKIQATETAVRKTRMLNPLIYIGAQYHMPFYDRLSVGVLSTTKIVDKARTWSEGRFSINLDPANWFSISTNYAYSTFGQSAGAALSFHFPGLNLFVGTDSYIPMTSVTPQYIPINAMTTSVTVGLNVMFGKYRGFYYTKTNKNK